GRARDPRRLRAAGIIGVPGERRRGRTDGAPLAYPPRAALRGRRNGAYLAGQEPPAREARRIRGEDQGETRVTPFWVSRRTFCPATNRSLSSCTTARCSPFSRRTVISTADLRVAPSSSACPARPPPSAPSTPATAEVLPSPTLLPAIPPTAPPATAPTPERVPCSVTGRTDSTVPRRTDCSRSASSR